MMMMIIYIYVEWEMNFEETLSIEKSFNDGFHAGDQGQSAAKSFTGDFSWRFNMAFNIDIMGIQWGYNMI